MAAYAALVSLAQTTDLNRYQDTTPFSSDAQEKMTSIHDYALYLQSFLQNFPQKASPWEARISGAAREAEDFIDDFLWLRIQPRDERRRVLPNLEDQLKHVMERIGLIVGDTMDERPSDCPSASSASGLSSSFSDCGLTGNDVVIGLEEDVTTIRGRLFGEPSDLQVIPIVGMGGIGKTTLARTVYNHPSISEHFDIRAWITVSQDYRPGSVEIIIASLLDSINLLEEQVDKTGVDSINLFEQHVDKTEVCEMATQVFQMLKYRRYVIVMDDVWNNEVWDDLMNIFPNDCNGSRILITTRLLEVSAYPSCCSPLHEMRVMNDDQSWELLSGKMLRKSNLPNSLQVIGKEIARMCAGLPLVLVLVGGLLSTVDDTQEAWNAIAKNIKTLVHQESHEILSLSYTHLPHHLRPCFLYLGGFPEDENIRSATLFRLWEAEGFLKYENGCGKSLEEVAEEYLEDLVKRNLVFANSRKINGKIKSCSVHDVVRDLCIRKAREEKFLGVIHSRNDFPYLMDARHFSLRTLDIYMLLFTTIRTILSFNLNYIAMRQRSLGQFRLLRVLHGSNLNLQEFFSQVFELIHLRYLSLEGLNITSAISKLVNLQTLIIHPAFTKRKRNWRDGSIYTSHIALPMEIWRMPQLKHLIFYDPIILPHLPDVSRSNYPLINLQTLSLAKNVVWSEKMVQMIPNVKKLGLLYTSDEECNIYHLKDLLQLEKLQLIFGCERFSSEGKTPTFPTTLRKLTLVGGGFPWVDMSIIGSLPNLQVLKLLDYVCGGETWVTGEDEFPLLKLLLIEAPFLQHWIMESSSFPILECLVLHSCRRLEKIPDDIGEIPTLELLELQDCKFSVVESAMEIKEYQQSCGNDALQLRCVERELGERRLWRQFPHEIKYQEDINMIEQNKNKLEIKINDTEQRKDEVS